MSEELFKTEYRKAADSIPLPENFEKNLLLNLDRFREETESEKTPHKSRTPLYLSLIAASLALIISLSLIFGLKNNSDTPPLTPLRREVTLSIRSAVNTQGVQGARVVFRDSSGNLVKDEDGATLETVSDENGTVVATLPEDTLTAEVSLEGYITLTQPLNTNEENIYISPVMNENTYRAVLSWDKTCDLDAVLSITADDKTEPIYYVGSDIKNKDGEVIAALDTDDTTGEGVETITFIPEKDSLIRYCVGSYSHLNGDYKENFGSTGATVTLYKGTEIIEVYELSPSSEGNTWVVFELLNDTLSKISSTKTVGAINEIE